MKRHKGNMAVEKILLLILSGAIGAGKTSVAKALMASFAFQKISISDYLISQIPNGELRKGDERRQQLQELGDCIDRETDYRWVVDPVAVQAIAQASLVESWLIDAVRRKRQVEHFRNQFDPKVRHIHLTAPEEGLRARHAQCGEDYDKAVAHELA
jgi:adenylate kinase family enzyme